MECCRNLMQCISWHCLQVAGVQYILDGVVAALLQNPDRRFSYAEMVNTCPCCKFFLLH